MPHRVGTCTSGERVRTVTVMVGSNRRDDSRGIVPASNERFCSYIRDYLPTNMSACMTCSVFVYKSVGPVYMITVYVCVNAKCRALIILPTVLLAILQN